ncbi:hypothetical protein Pint_18119 [Pistacia integerrima]|uniref:Uncharacterized protein n=1 Tax=Pistacia integerrima TaxID=434235 RepID=A0ACC0Z197_9ROSI|nr:hypothetical protein Pint_18119 [Pistacia integerrima]
MRCFPYTLKDRAKAWFMNLQPGSLTTWEAVYNKCMGKFYSHQKTADLRSKIATFSQMEGEPFHKVWTDLSCFSSNVLTIITRSNYKISFSMMD